MGSRQDGWWRELGSRSHSPARRVGALNGAEVTLSAGLGTVRITGVRAVVEGAAERAEGPETVSVLGADRDGDSEIVEEVSRLTASGKIPLVVTG